MNDFERFEAELKRLAPAQPPEDFMARLQAARPQVHQRENPSAWRPKPLLWSGWWRWLAPVAALVVVALVLFSDPIWRSLRRQPAAASPLAIPSRLQGAASKVDLVQINNELVGSFDTIARLPSGEPIRFRCRRWIDQVTVEDTKSGMVVEERTPRLEVLPVRFETY
jgi:hypothetical protein